MLRPVLRLDSREAWRPCDVCVSLEQFGYRWDADADSWQLDGKAVDRINLPPLKPRDAETFTLAGYHRVVRGGGLHWHQFWTWWVHNPKRYAGVGEHEGDWEMVQFGCTDEAGDNPILTTYAQHGGGQQRCYWDVELTEGKQGDPVVYVARDSHASYFAPTRTATDQADGRGSVLVFDWLPFGKWRDWLGQWGNSANSPGPLPTRRVWRAPQAWHSQAR